MIRLLPLFALLVAPWAHADSVANRYTASGISVFTNACRVWDAARFQDAVKLFEASCADPSATATNFYWLGAGQFHYALNLLGSTNVPGHKAAAAAALGQAAAALARALKLDDRHAESHALIGTIYGMEISENWLRALTLGPKVQKEFKLARNFGPDDARVLYLLGTSQFYCAGSDNSRREALATLLDAEKLFQLEAKTPPGPLEPRWGHDSCLTFIAECFEKLGNETEAEGYFRKALALNPENDLSRTGLARLKRNKK